jgi:predicted RNase H-like HicB family nuclease
MKMIFRVVVEKDESGYYVGEVPALPGCLSQGKTVEELKVNIAEAIEGWLEVMNDKAKKRNAQMFEITV